MKKALAFGSRAQILMLLVGASTQAQTIGPVVISPTSTPAGIAATVVVTAKITDTSVIGSTVNLQRLDAQGRVLAVIGEMRDDGKNGDSVANDRTFTIRFSVYEEKPGALTFRSSAGVQGSLLRINSTLLRFDVTGAFPTGVSITQPANLEFVNTSPITIAGTAGDPTATVRVNGIQATKNGNAFQTTVPLQEGNNTITAVATNSNASTSSASIQVTLDTTPPHVIVESPANGFTTTEAVLTFTGIVNDIVVGTVNSLQAQVTVKGLNAVVANRTFTAANVPLALGLNKIPVIARDQTGNSATTTIDVTRQAITQPFIKLISGNNQSGLVGSPVPLPLIVQLLNGAVPVPNTPVTFKITENDGFLQPGVGKPQTIVVNTDAQGRAQGLLTLGNRSGAGNNSVEVYSGNFQGTALFIASGNPKPAAKINVDSGNSQFGAVNQPLVLPFVAVVTDQGNNRLAGVTVTFAVKQGGGTINGLASQQTITDGDGRALAILTLGSQPGQDNNLVEATFTGNPGFPAAFSASGKTPGNPNQTSISGVVLDNSNNPIPNVTMRVYQTNQGNNNNQHLQVGTPVPTDVKGLFKILPAPVGFYKLMADGTTATQNGKLYPTLEYDLVTVAGQDNTVGSPIYLPELDPLAKVCVNATTGGVLKVSTSPGFSLTILPGAATFPGGSKTGCVSVTPVNPDKVPMVPGFGQQPRYVVTIQPVGTMFNPPAAITIPNMDGLSPNAKTEMYSYDHDLAAFVAIGSATLSPDGSIIASDPGVGVLKAGWHCGGDPSVPGSGQPVSVKIQTPGPLKMALDATQSVVSAGSPLPGKYKWKSSDSAVVDIVGSETTAAISIKGKAAGKSTLTARFTCDSVDQNGVHPFAEATIEVTVIDADSIEVTLVSTKNAVSGVAPAAGKFTTTNKLIAHVPTTPADLLVSMKDAGTMTAKAINVKPPASVADLSWVIQRNPADTVAAGDLAVTGAPGVQVTFDPSKAGNFRLVVYCDSNGNSKFDNGEEIRVARMAFVQSTVQAGHFISTAAVFTGAAASMSTKGTMAIRGDFLLEGGAANRQLGLDQIVLGNLGNAQNDTFQVNYPIPAPAPPAPGNVAGKGNEVIGAPVPAIDTVNVVKGSEPTGASTPFRGNTSDTGQGNGPGGNGQLRRIASLDEPAFGWDNLHPTTGNVWATTQGANFFREWLVAYSKTYPRNYTALATGDWTLNATGTRTADVWKTNGASVTIPGAVAGSAGLTVTGYPKTGDASGMQVLGLSFVREYTMVYVP